mgnify:CR=1 FL=1
MIKIIYTKKNKYRFRINITSISSLTFLFYEKIEIVHQLMLVHILNNMTTISQTENVDNIQYISQISMKSRDGRHYNKFDEKIRINKLCSEINNNTSTGKLLKDEYEKEFGKKIKSVSPFGGNREHFDILVTDEDNKTRKIEEKHSNKGISNKTPWDDSVQRYNGPANQFSICKFYALLWYIFIIRGGEIQEYCECCDIPSFPVWYEKDAMSNGDPRTTWGKKLKKKYQEEHPKSSMNGKNNSPKDLRKYVNYSFERIFNQNEQMKNILINETQIIMDKIMKEKEGWLQTTGVIESNTFKCKWSDQIASPTIISVEASYKEGSDIYFVFKTQEENNEFKSIIRFGKGTGFSNIRYDIR